MYNEIKGPGVFTPSRFVMHDSYSGACKLVFLTKAKFTIFGYFFENDVKNLSDVKTFFQIFNCKLNYNGYAHNYGYTNPLLHDSLRTISDLEKAVHQKWRREKG
jgi:hypothetical protein